jgi:hypothetical protein
MQRSVWCRTVTVGTAGALWYCSAQFNVGKVKGRDGKALALHHRECQGRRPWNSCATTPAHYPGFHTIAHPRKCRARTRILETRHIK